MLFYQYSLETWADDGYDEEGSFGHELYSLTVPVYINENGYARIGEETGDPDSGIIQDDDRIGYLQSALATVEELLGDGVDLRGYYLWMRTYSERTYAERFRD